jgi:DNA-binding CsgD family transcriptional regulator
MPYPRAKALWWQALAILESRALGEEPSEAQREAARAAARRPLAEAYEIARALPALPLLREIVDLSVRARVPLPVGAAGPGEVTAAGLAVPVERGLVAVGPGAGEQGPGAGPPDVVRLIEERVLAGLRAGPSDVYGLTPREREVLNVLAEGRTDRDIAARLFISERTVHVHVRRILAKLGVASRTEAAGVAIRKGLVPVDTPPAAPGRRGRDGVASLS